MQISELKLAKDLIRKPSITPKDAGAINLLAKNLRSIGFNCKIINFKNVKNLYAKLGKFSPNFCYAGHTDVVPPGNIKNWTTNPFKPIVKNKKLIGRGANDMKASIACFVAAVSRFKNKNRNFKGSISLLITGDEEGIAVNGTKRVVKYLKRKTGARGLRSILESILMETMYKVPSEESLNKVVLDSSVVKGETEPLMVYEKTSKTKTG